MKKRMFLIVLTMCAILCGCGKNVEEEPTVEDVLEDYMSYDTEEMEEDLEFLNNSLYSQYDNTEMIGAGVTSALKTFVESTDFTVFITPNSTPYTEDGADVQAYVYCGVPSDYSEGLYTVEWSEKMECFGATLQDGVSLQNDMSATQDSSSADTYIDFNATYHADLVHDKATGEVIGILFRIITS